MPVDADRCGWEPTAGWPHGCVDEVLFPGTCLLVRIPRADGEIKRRTHILCTHTEGLGAPILALPALSRAVRRTGLQFESQNSQRSVEESD